MSIFFYFNIFSLLIANESLQINSAVGFKILTINRPHLHNSKSQFHHVSDPNHVIHMPH